MFLLPRGNALYEGVAAARTKPPAVLQRLRSERLTGYACFTFPSTLGILLFQEGRLLSALLERGAQKITGLDAVTAVFEQIATEGGRLDVYRLSPDLAVCVQALLHGEALYQGQAIGLIDVRGLLDKIKVQKVSGCLRIYTDQRTALIFYKNGSPLGFFHDGSQQIETSASESQRIAGLPGAKLDVYSNPNGGAPSQFDLLEVVNVDKVWEMTVSRHTEELANLAEVAEAREQRQREGQLDGLTQALAAVATRFLGPMGEGAVSKAVGAQGGKSALLDGNKVAALLGDIEKAARLLTGASQTEQLLQALRTEIETRLGNDLLYDQPR